MKCAKTATALSSLPTAACLGSSDPITLTYWSRDLSLVRAVRVPEVLHLTGLGRSTWYALLNPKDPSYDPMAPKPFKLGKSRNSPSVWWAWQVIAYLEAKHATQTND